MSAHGFNLVARIQKKRKNLGTEYYDLTDPFIDDSELAIDERTFIAQTKQQGFYVFSGEVALLKEKSLRKPKSKKSALPAPEPIAGPSNYPHVLSHSNNSQVQPQGSKDVPIALLSDSEETSGKRRTRASGESPNGKKKRRVVDIVREVPIHVSFRIIDRPFSQHPFHPELEAAIEDLKVAISNGACPSSHPPALVYDMDVFGRELGAERQVSARNSSDTCRCCAQGDQIERVQRQLFQLDATYISLQPIYHECKHGPVLSWEFTYSCMRNAETYKASNLS